MIVILLSQRIAGTKLYEKRNPFAKSLFTSKYKPRKVKPKKGKGSFKRKKISNLNNLR